MHFEKTSFRPASFLLVLPAGETENSMKHYDRVVIGTGPAGQKGAIQAAKLGKRVAIIEKNRVLGGAQVNTRTIPSKALREAVLHLTGGDRSRFFAQSKTEKKRLRLPSWRTSRRE